MAEYPHEILTRVKDGLKKCVGNHDRLDEISTEDFDKSRSIITKLCNEDGLNVTDILKSCLDPDEFLTYAYDGIRKNSESLLFIQATFNPFINILKSKSVMVQFIPVEFDPPENLTYRHNYEEIEKCDRKLKEY
ncbi:hypothetical protein [Paenibacillus sp. M2]|uniref:hypothetical protein n=1 Tax=Paenibacillus sp. M2 TaxID=3341793 RepID=UPI003989A1A3